MVNLNKIKKAQSLPLNTIVIAVLVIIVLLVIIVFFTVNMGKTGEAFNNNDAKFCGPSNPALITAGYDDNDLYVIPASIGVKTCNEVNKKQDYSNYSSVPGLMGCCVKRQ